MMEPLILVQRPTASSSSSSPILSHTNFETVVPKPTLPNPEQFVPIEQFVQDAILSRHNPLPVTATTTTTTSSKKVSSSSTGMATYKALLEVLRLGTEEDPHLLGQVLLAMIYNHQGIPLKCIVSENERHKTLLHYIFRLNPFHTSQQQQQHRLKHVDLIHKLQMGVNGSTVVTPPHIQGDHHTETSLEIQHFVVHADNLIDIYLHFLVTLVSANSTFLSSTLETLWKLLLQVTMSQVQSSSSSSTFTPLEQSNDLQVLPPPPMDDSLYPPQDQDEKEMDEVNNSSNSKDNTSIWILKLHTTLAKILHLVPKGKTELYSVLSSTFPYKLAPVQRQVSFLQQCLICIQNYLPTAHAPFLELWLDKCLEMDVEIRIEENGQVQLLNSEDDDSNPSNKSKGEGEKEEELEENGGNNENIVQEEENQKEEEKVEPNKDIEKVNEMANKVRR